MQEPRDPFGDVQIALLGPFQRLVKAFRSIWICEDMLRIAVASPSERANAMSAIARAMRPFHPRRDGS